MSRSTGVVTALLAAGIYATLATLAGPAALKAPAPGTASTSPKVSTGNDVIRVYYFHATYRCASCKKIEAYSAEAVRDGFERELRDGRMEFHAVNLDEPSNRHFVQDYKLFTKSVVVVDVANGRQVRWKNLPRIWELVRDRSAFHQYVQGEVRMYLEERP